MKLVEVKDQVRLSLGKCFELVLSGVKYRLFRAAITVTIISLAAAFVTTMLTESLVARRVEHTVSERTWPREKFLLLTSRLTQPVSEQDLTEDLSPCNPPTPERNAYRADRLKEFKLWGKLDDTEMSQLVQVATDQVTYQNFFQTLNEGERRALIGRARGIQVLLALQDGRVLEQFKERLGELGIRGRFPDPDADLQEFRGFLTRWKQTAPLREKILKGHAAVVEQLRIDLLKGRNVKELLGKADETLLTNLGGYGFQLSKQDLESIRDRAVLALDTDKVMVMSTVPRVRVSLEHRLNTRISDLTDEMFLDEIGSTKGAKWLAELSRDIGAPLGLSVERVKEVARETLDQRKLADVESIVEEAAGAGGILGFSQRTVWLLIVSFMVCIVGIANAMLMSVTERFREIATMKCLGATDGFIMLNFILESCMQGVAGGLIGAMLGILLGMMRSGWKFGWMGLAQFPGAQVATAGGMAVVAGVMISALAAVYPAWVAARLAPMEAMRIE